MKAFILSSVLLVALLFFGSSAGWFDKSDANVKEAASAFSDRHKTLQATKSHTAPANAPSSSDGKRVPLSDFIALSSFFPPNVVGGLSNETLARLESTLMDARRTTYSLLLERGTITHTADGSYKVAISGSTALESFRDAVYDVVADIVGTESAPMIVSAMGSKFDAHFAYFGRYDTELNISVELAPDSSKGHSYVTMRSEFRRGVLSNKLLMNRMIATHVHSIDKFERNYLSLSDLSRN